MRSRTLLLALIVLLALTAVGSAHTPIFLPDGRTGVRVRELIADPSQSWAIYGTLPDEAAADLIPLQAEKGQPLYIQVLVPDRPDLAAFRPQVVLLGPGLPGAVPPVLSVDMPAGHGALVVENPAKPHPLYEEFTQMNFLRYGTVESRFPESGRYHLVIYDPEGKGGLYTVALGKREVFGLRDLLTFPLVWARAHVWLWK